MFRTSLHLSCRHPKNTNVVEGMVKALARVVSSVQVQNMFSIYPLLISSNLIVYLYTSGKKFDIIPSSVLLCVWLSCDCKILVIPSV